VAIERGTDGVERGINGKDQRHGVLSKLTARGIRSAFAPHNWRATARRVEKHPGT
jgi:hypothetical protein